MSERNWLLFIEDILESNKKIQNYLKELTIEEFKKDDKTIDAIVRNLEIIGEATKNIPEEIKNKHPDIYWKGMTGLRNRIIHAYFDVDLDIIWKIIKDELPILDEKIKKIIITYKSDHIIEKQ